MKRMISIVVMDLVKNLRVRHLCEKGRVRILHHSIIFFLLDIIRKEHNNETENT